MTTLGPLLYRNPLATAADLAGWRLEGEGALTFPRGRLRLEGTLDPGPDGDPGNQRANLVLWCPQDFPDHIQLAWDFYPLREPGLAILFFAATGRRGEDLFDPALAPRSGPYGQYHHGDINALHVSYFRRRYAHERVLNTCNLRKSHGFHLVTQGADPIPTVRDAAPPYRIVLRKAGPHVSFAINEIPIFSWTDDGQTYGPLLTGGKVGFRQMTPLIAEYANLEVHALPPA
jgi:hypothetical protein